MRYCITLFLGLLLAHFVFGDGWPLEEDEPAMKHGMVLPTDEEDEFDVDDYDDEAFERMYGFGSEETPEEAAETVAEKVESEATVEPTPKLDDSNWIAVEESPEDIPEEKVVVFSEEEGPEIIEEAEVLLEIGAEDVDEETAMWAPESNSEIIVNTDQEDPEGILIAETEVEAPAMEETLEEVVVEEQPASVEEVIKEAAEMDITEEPIVAASVEPEDIQEALETAEPEEAIEVVIEDAVEEVSPVEEPEFEIAQVEPEVTAEPVLAEAMEIQEEETGILVASGDNAGLFIEEATGADEALEIDIAAEADVMEELAIIQDTTPKTEIQQPTPVTETIATTEATSVEESLWDEEDPEVILDTHSQPLIAETQEPEEVVEATEIPEVEIAMEEEPLYRAVTVDDMKGLWEQVAVKPGELEDMSDPWFSARQMYNFTNEGFMKNLVARGDNLPGNAEQLIKSAKGSTQYEFVNSQGLMRIQYADGTTYDVLCTYCNMEGEKEVETNMAGDNVKIQPGDIIMSYFEEGGGDKILFRRLLRHRS